MSLTAYEGIVENGQIRLSSDARLPEHAKVYVLVPEGQEPPIAHVYSPRLVDPRDISRFEMEIVEEPTDAGL